MGLGHRAIKMSRRSLLQLGVATGTTYAALNGTSLALGKAWAAERKGLSPHEHITLMRFARDLFPHKQLDDTFYAAAIAPLDSEAAKDPAAKTMLAKGVASLDALTMKDGGKRFATTPAEAKRIAAIKTIEGSPFFAKIFGTTRGTLYNERKAWPIFGFEGPSSPLGGYLHRGFNDLDWL